MKLKTLHIPGFIIGLAILFWGWQYESFVISITLAVIYEILNLNILKLTAQDESVEKVIDATFFLTGLLTAILLILEAKTALFYLREYLPIILFPLLITQRVANRRINLRTIFILTRKKGKINKKPRYVGFEPLFLFLTILSAGYANSRSAYFFPVLLLILLLVLFFYKAKSTNFFSWLCLFFLVSLSSYYFSTGIYSFQQELRTIVTDWLIEHFNLDNADPTRSQTSIGSIRKSKNSGKIILRLASREPILLPALLKEASYDFYLDGVWTSTAKEFKQIPGANSKWYLKKQGQSLNNQEVLIYTEQNRRNKLLKYLNNTFSVSGRNLKKLSRNKFGAIKIDYNDDFDSYKLTIVAKKQKTSDSLFTSKLDLYIPPLDTANIDSFINIYNLKQLRNLQETKSKLKEIFIKDFRYTLDYKIKEKKSEYTDLSFFLLQSKAGHCEYFATGSVFILRRLGFKARYTTGYSLQEFDNLEKMYLARKRHAHAWCEVLENNEWTSFDPTPPDWNRIEEESFSLFAKIRDLFSFAYFKFDQFRKTEENALFYVLGFFSLLVVFYIWRIFFRGKNTKKKKGERKKSKQKMMMKSAEYLELEKKFAKSGHKRYDFETIEEWFQRIEKDERFNKETLNKLKSRFNKSRYG